MGLDAHVCCDCFERGRLLAAPPPGCTLSVTEDGSLLCGSDDLKVQIAFDRWRHSEACEHEDGYLVAHRIGNVALVSSLRRELGRWPERFPEVLSRVIYDGVHCGDSIPAAGAATGARGRGPDPRPRSGLRHGAVHAEVRGADAGAGHGGDAGRQAASVLTEQARRTSAASDRGGYSH